MKQLLIVLAALASTSIGFAQGKGQDKTQTVSLKVTENGFEPGEIKVKPGAHVILKVTRKTEQTCATQIKINGKKTDLPLDKEVSVDAGTLKKGEVKFACGMDMITGHIITE